MPSRLQKMLCSQFLERSTKELEHSGQSLVQVFSSVLMDTSHPLLIFLIMQLQTHNFCTWGRCPTQCKIHPCRSQKLCEMIHMTFILVKLKRSRPNISVYPKMTRK